MKVRKIIRSIPLLIWIIFKNKKFKGKLHYLFINNKSDTLIVVFSAFTGEKRKYNYVKGLKALKFDKLYVLDDFGYTGSYNLYENGSNYPEQLTFGLLDQYIKGKKYKHVYTAGSSKGGTCAIYFGLPYNVEAIFSGACQYNLGSYLHRVDHEKIFTTMMGNENKEFNAKLLNELIPNQLEKFQHADTVIHVFYSKKELTYERQIVDLLNKLNELKMKYVDFESDFLNHDDVGKYFLSYLLDYFNIR